MKVAFCFGLLPKQDYYTVYYSFDKFIEFSFYTFPIYFPHTY